MDIVIFKELTTNEYLKELKLESEKYTGLYVDMENAKERKYVKDKADDINQILKKVERLRIDASRDYKAKVELEAADITERLELANLPFTLLIDEHKAERKKILDAEKADRDARELASQKESDHEFALLMDSKIDSDRRDQVAAMEKYEADMKAEAAAEAKMLAELAAEADKLVAEKEKQDAINREAQAKQNAIDSENARVESEKQAKQAAIEAEDQRNQDAISAEKRRLADIEFAKQTEIKRQKDELKAKRAAQAKIEANKNHVGKIRGEIKVQLMTACGLDNELATKVVKALLHIDQVTINY